VHYQEFSTLANWFRERASFPIQIPRLSNAHLLAGRLCSLFGQRVALVFYERGGKRLSLFTLAADVVPVGVKEKMQAAKSGQSAMSQTIGEVRPVFCGLGRHGASNCCRRVGHERPYSESFSMALKGSGRCFTVYNRHGLFLRWPPFFFLCSQADTVSSR